MGSYIQKFTDFYPFELLQFIVINFFLDRDIIGCPLLRVPYYALGYTGAKIASELRLSEKSVSRCIERGQRLLDNDKGMLEYLR